MDITTLPTYYYQIVLTVFIILVFFSGNYFIKRIVKKRAARHSLDIHRIFYTVRFFNFLWSIIILTILSLIWDVSFQGLSIYFASIFTVIGVAFFAQWSILSNITAGVILFFNYSYKIGNTIRIIDGENSVEGVVNNIQLFYLQIKIKSGELISYPNNLIIQKPIQIVHAKEQAPND